MVAQSRAIQSSGHGEYIVRSDRGDDPVLDVSLLGDAMRFPLHAVRRHRLLSRLLFCSVAGLSIAAAVLLPRGYQVITTISAQRNIVMPALDNPRRAVPSESDAPTRLAAEAVMSRDNLEGIIRDANLLGEWSAIRSPLGRLRERIRNKILAPPSDSERVDALVHVLERRLWVSKSDEGTVTIGLSSWPDPRTAQRIVLVAQQSFLQQRHETEMSLIGESIAILERHVESAHEAIGQSLSELGDMSRPSRRDAGTSDQSSSRPSPVSPAKAQEIAGLQATLAAKRTTIADLEASRAQQLAALQVRLDELRRSYGSAHPDIASTEQNIQVLGNDSPQLLRLRSEVQDLRQQLASLGASEGSGTPTGSLEPALARAALERLSRNHPDSIEDPRVTYAKSRLKIAIGDYEDLLQRLESARIELETARAAFKYRFSIITPPELPRRAVTPNVPALVVGGLVLATMLALFGATAMDLSGGRILESWQVDRQLGLPVLGEVPRL